MMAKRNDHDISLTRVTSSSAERRAAIARTALVMTVVAVLSGCWTIQPERHIEFKSPLKAERHALDEGPTVWMEIDGDHLIATAPLRGGAVALYYTDRGRVKDPFLTVADVTRTVLLSAGGPESSPVEAELRDDATAAFPLLFEYREEHSGYEDRDDDDRSSASMAARQNTGDLRWRFEISVPVTPTDHVESPGGNEPIVVAFQTIGSIEDDTRMIFVRVRRDVPSENGDIASFSLARTTFGVKERLDAEVQRLLRGIRYDGRFLLVYDRLVDVTTGTVTPLIDRAPASFVDHIAWNPALDLAAIVYGAPRISKQLILAPFSLVD